MEILEKLDKLINTDYIENKCVTASELIQEHRKYCEKQPYSLCSKIGCSDCFAIFTVDNFSIERK